MTEEGLRFRLRRVACGVWFEVCDTICRVCAQVFSRANLLIILGEFVSKVFQDGGHAKEELVSKEE